MKVASFLGVAAIAILALASSARLANADCTPAAPNPCYNAPGNASICCPGACGPSTGEGGVTATCAGTPPPATPAPTAAPTPNPTSSGPLGTVYLAFDFSKPETNCANQAAGPGGQFSFGDICVYKGPILASDLQTQVGTFVEIDATFQGGASDLLSASTTFYFTTGEIKGPVDAINTIGTASTEVTELAIIGGTGKYRGANGYVVSGLGVDISPGADGSILAFPKEFRLF
ncbi:hypothetical protein KFL_003960040 [Klebsormidium nitens]|uniref:Dirigent protein n=1 Tax=Klebsormidium nitens TaxID=105231 RepID=A0A1Y1IBU4_KLENI|nr:hypothetical protein KFL_003960040 [Klebsormidium nitens]|eukprot:GAQ88043.1 hypothetical protein KFL_003960040 [Klebsormidium nitens]